MGKIDIYGWGGVNTTKNPVQLENSELTKAQNAIRDAAGEHGALRKRPGLTKINTIALSGSVNGFVNVPINVVGTRRFLVGVDQDITASYQWITSTDTFTNTSTATSPAACTRGNTTRSQGWFAANGGNGASLTNRACQIEDRFIYPGDYTRGNPAPVRIYDGTVDKFLFEIPLNAKVVADIGLTGYATKPGSIMQMLVVGKKIYLVSIDYVHVNTGSYSRIMEYDMETGTLSQIGQSCSGWVNDVCTASNGGDTGGSTGVFSCVAWHQGMLYAGVGPPPAEVANSTGAGVYRIRPGVDTTWTYDFDNSGAADTDLETPVCMASYKGKLYVGMMDQNSATARIVVRDYAGSYSNSTTGGSSTGSAWTDMIVFGENLYACLYDDNGGSSTSSIWKFDNSSWTNVKTLSTATANPYIGVSMVVHNGRLFVLALNDSRSAMVTHTADGSSWTDQTSNMGNSNMVSPFGVLTT